MSSWRRRAFIPAPAYASNEASGPLSNSVNLGCYFMDDRAPVAALLEVARALSARQQRPAGDVYVVFTTSEEVGGIGGTYASRTLPGDLTIALEVGPTEAEYATTVSGGPIVVYSDALCTHGYEVIHRQAIPAMASILVEFVLGTD